MNAINHAAMALVINKRWPTVPIVPILISVQLVELLWVFFNLLGIERTEVSSVIETVKDVHLAYMPYSHSIITTGLLATAVWFFFAKVLNKKHWGIALGMGVFSHTLLDLLVHAPDMPIAPGIEKPLLGLGLYDVPILAFMVETLFGLLCWKYYRGSRALLAVIVLFNLSAISFYTAIPGPEAFLAGQPLLFVVFIAIHIVSGLAAIWYFSRSSGREPESAVAEALAIKN